MTIDLRDVPGASYQAQWMRDKRALTPGYYAAELRAHAAWRERNRTALRYILRHRRETGETISVAEARRRLGLPPGDPKFGHRRSDRAYTLAMWEHAWLLRAEGLLFKQVAHRMGVTPGYARQMSAAFGKLVSRSAQHVIFPKESRYGYGQGVKRIRHRRSPRPSYAPEHLK